jgi:hypothetical protein
MTAPMDTVIDLNNINSYLANHIVAVLPRTVTIYDFINEYRDSKNDFRPPHFTFISFGLEEFKSYILKKSSFLDGKFVLLDVANGHMKIISELATKFKKIYPNTELMIGNIANPETYKELALTEAIDFIRIGIGNGGGCLTTKQTSIGYPKASLIKECYKIKKELIDQYTHQYFHSDDKELLNKKINSIPMIVADGGMKDYSDIIKALGLGADYVMVGSIFNKSFESSGDFYFKKIKISKKTAKWLYDHNVKIKKQFYGMSTKIAQKKLGKINLKTSEGVVRYRTVEYSLNSWVENFKHYLMSAMSYFT